MSFGADGHDTTDLQEGRQSRDRLDSRDRKLAKWGKYLLILQRRNEERLDQT